MDYKEDLEVLAVLHLHGERRVANFHRGQVSWIFLDLISKSSSYKSLIPIRENHPEDSPESLPHRRTNQKEPRLSIREATELHPFRYWDGAAELLLKPSQRVRLHRDQL